MFENFTQPRKQFTRVSLVTLVTNSTFVIRIYLYSYQVFLNVGHFDSRMDSWGHKEFTLSMNAVRTKYLYKCLFVGHVDSEMDSLKSWWWTTNFVNCHQINKLKENTQKMSQKSLTMFTVTSDIYNFLNMYKCRGKAGYFVHLYWFDTFITLSCIDLYCSIHLMETI